MPQKVILLSHVFNNRLNDLFNSSNKEDVIYCYQTKNTISFWLFGIEKNRVASHFKITEGALEKNSVAGHFKIEKRAIEKNRVANHSKIKKQKKCANKDIFEVSFFYQKIIKYN